ncbi:MAG: hypothetical protein LBE16_01910, partial [Clostridiales Family XIII bacterium]|nr:hypothetical protein [Clostridiales Family XIII bacterium]
MKKKNTSVAVAAVLLLALSGCKEEAPPETQQLVYPPVRHIAAVVDGTGSTNVAFSESVKSAIMEELRIREMPPEETLKDGTDGVPGTRMLLYRVADNPQAFDGIAHWVKIEIDPVPALPPRPTVDADGDEYALEKYAAWKDLKLSYIEAYKKAAQMSQKAIRDLTAFSLDSGGKYSGIYNSIDALMANAGA